MDKSDFHMTDSLSTAAHSRGHRISLLKKRVDSNYSRMLRAIYWLYPGGNTRQNSSNTATYHCCILTSAPAKHAIPKAAEVHIPLAWASLAVESQTDAPVERDLWTAWQLFLLIMMTKHAIPKTVEVPIPMACYGEILSGCELLYNRVHWKFNQFGEKML